MALSTWPPLLESELKSHRAILTSGLEAKRTELFLNRGFAFQSSAWWRLGLVMIELSRVWRQSDAQLVGTLNRIRRGLATQEDVRWLNRHCGTSAQPTPQHPPPPTAAAAAAASSAASSAAAAAPARRPMLLAPVNAAVSERNAKEIELMRRSRSVTQWLASDWVAVDEDHAGSFEDVQVRRDRRQPSISARLCL